MKRKITTEVEILPIRTPNFVITTQKPQISIDISDLTKEEVIELAEQFKNDLINKWGKEQ